MLHRFFWLNTTWLCCGLISISLDRISSPLSAQTINPNLAPNPVIRSPERLPDLTPSWSFDPIPPSNSFTPSAPISPIDGNGVPTTIKILRYEVIGTDVLGQAEVDAATSKFTGDRKSITDIQNARAEIDKLLFNKQYITSGARVPPDQDLQIDGAIVKIEVIPGRLEEIKVSGGENSRLNPSYVKSRLEIATGAPLNKERLLEALQLLQLDPLIKNISAELSAGTKPGTNLLEIKFTENPSFSTQISLNNNRSPSIGSFERRIQINQENLLGIGDGINIAYANTDGSNSIDARYSIPISPYNTTLSFSFGKASSRVIEAPFNQLDILSSSLYYEMSLRQPILQTVKDQIAREIALGLTTSHQQSETSLLNTPFPLSVGADDQGRTSVSTLRFFQEYIQRDSQEAWFLRSQFSLGLNALNATINATAPDGRFVAWRGQGRWHRNLSSDMAILVRGDVQLSDRTLVPLEQISLGGQSTVRGYRQDLALNDNGAFASAELQFPILRTDDQKSILKISPFIEYGNVWKSSGGANSTPNNLASIGVGLEGKLGGLTARFDWGIPLLKDPSRRNTWQENGLYFSIQYNPF